MESAQEPLAVGQIYIHERTKREYEVLELVQVKDPGDANWKDGVKYFPLDNATVLPYVRVSSDFLDKFSLKGVTPHDISSGKNLHRGADNWHEPGKD